MAGGNTTRDGNFVPGGSIGIIEQLDLTTRFPQTVAILDGSGNQITSFGGGTQYDAGTTVATPVGTVALGYDGADVQALKTLSTGELVVSATNFDIRDISASTDAISIHGSIGVVEQFALPTSNPIKTALVDGNGDQITSIGGGTEYSNGDSVAVPIGKVIMFRQSGDNTVQSVADDNPMPVTVINSSVLPTGAATSAKQDSQITLQTQLESLVETLQELVQRLAPLAGAMSNPAALRVAPVSSVSTAVTGPITSAQSIAEKAVAGILYPEKMALTNTAAVLSNINNCVAA